MEKDTSTYPLSLEQAGLWSLEKMEDVKTAYHVVVSMEIISQYEPHLLKEFFQIFVERHRNCMPSFRFLDGEIRQSFPEQVSIDFRIINAGNFTDEELQLKAKEASDESFDLDNGPLLKIFLFTRGPENAVLIISAHHLCIDGFSQTILIDELKKGYTSLVKTGKYSPTPLKKDYSEYAEWQRRLVTSDDGLKQKEFWLEKLEGDLPSLQLPVDRKRNKPIVYRGSTYFFSIPKEKLAKISQFNKNHKSSMLSFFMSVYQVLLFSYSNQTDLIIGHAASGRMRTAAGRKRSDFNDNFGYFINLLMYRSNFTLNTAFDELVKLTTKQLKDDLKNQDYPFSELYRELELRQRDLPIPRVHLNFHKSRNDHRDLAFNFFDLPEKKQVDLGELKIQSYYLPRQEGVSDLEWEVYEAKESIYCNLRYRTDIFDEETISRMEGHINTIIDEVIKTPNIQLSEISLSSEREINTILSHFNDTESDISSLTFLTVAELFEDQAKQTPDEIAVELGDQKITYGELNKRANQLSVALDENGVRSGDVVGLMVQRSVELITSILAVLKVGGAFVPIDPRLPDERKQYMLSNAGCRTCITTSNITPPPYDECMFLNIDYLPLDVYSGDNGTVRTKPDDLAYIIYTSGSTGKPKGVMLEHTGFLNMITDQIKAYSVNCDDVLLQFASFSFDASLYEIFISLLSGAKLVLIKPELLIDIPQFQKYIAIKGITVAVLPPVFLKELNHNEVGGLRMIVTAGESPITDDIERFRKRVQYVNAYGPTEYSVCASRYFIDSEAPLPEIIPIGKPIANTRIYIFDENRNLCPVGVQGEIYCAGVGVARGYINNPELTNEKFMPDPFYPEERMYRTGDLGKWLSDGNIEFCGRIDHQIKISGYRVELGEIEQQLMSCSGISQAVVIDCINKQGTKYLTSFIVRDYEISEGEIKAELSGSLPYYMIPTQFHFLETLPITSNGKVDRKELVLIEKESFSSVQKENSSKVVSSESIETLLEIWKSILGLTSVDITKNFFDLGGHSLLVVELQNRISRELEVELPITDLFTYSTIESLSTHIDKSLNVSNGDNIEEKKFEEYEKIDSDDIAIIGMAGKFPGAKNIDQLWENLKSGEESITTFTQKELLAEGVSAEVLENPNYIPVKGVLEDVDLLDAHFFKFNPRDAELTDPQHRLFLETVHTSFEHAGYDYQTLKVPVGVFASTGHSSYLQQNIGSDLSMQDQEYHQVMIGNDKDFLATRVAYKFNFTGPAQTIQTACSSSLVNVHFACESLLTKSCDMALAGGVSITFPMKSGYLYSPDGIASKNGQCRPFDSEAKGTVPGNGVAAVLLKRLSDAERDGDTVYAVIKGSAINNDGSGKIGFTAPSVTGQKEVMQKALYKANIPAESIGFIEAHGTGTSLGDPIEFKALSEVYSQNRLHSCGVGSIKSNIGHLDSAAGVTGLIKAALSLYHKTIVPTVHYKEPNSALQIEKTDLYIANELVPWESSSHSRRAAVSSLGLGGTNAHVVLEEAVEPKVHQVEKEFFLLPLSAPTSEQLNEYQARVNDYLVETDNSLMDTACTLAVGRQQCEKRSVSVVSKRSKHTPWKSPSTLLNNPQVVWLFPGQGSQYIHMGYELYHHEPTFRKALDNCFDLLKSAMGVNFSEILFPSDANRQEAESKLSQTEITQPVLFSLSVSLAELWKAWGVTPDSIIGHSFGEYAGAVTAGILSLEDAVILISRRAELIQKIQAGSMLSVFGEVREIRDLLDESLSIAAYNSSKNFVVSGPSKKVSVFARELKGLNIHSQELPVSHAFHSSMMNKAALEFRKTVEKISLNEPKIPIISTLTGKYISMEMSDPDYWCRQITDPVRFSDAIATALEKETVFLEVGASDTLCKLIKTDRHKEPYETLNSLPHRKQKCSDMETILNSIGMLWCLGIPLELGILCSNVKRRVAVPSMPLNNKSYWIEPSPDTKKSSSQRTNDPAEWIYAPTWIPSIPPNRNWKHDLERCSITWLIFLDKVGLGDELAAKLRSTGQKVITVRFSPDSAVSDNSYYDSDSFVINQNIKEEYDSFFKELVQRNSLPDRIVHLSLLTSNHYKDFEEENLDTINYLGFFSLLFIVKALQNNHIDKMIEFTTITDHIFSVNGEDWINPLKAPVQGPITVIPQEHKSINMQHIDVSLEKSAKEIHWLAEFLIQDIINFKSNMTLAYRNHRRWTRGFEQLKAEPGSVNIKRNGVYLITGGMGDIGLSIASDFAHTANATLILMGDTNLPDRKTWKSIIRRNEEHDRSIIQKLQTIIEIEEIGCRVILATIDFSDKKQLGKILARIEEKTGRINGIIHATGTVGNSLISTRTIDNIEQIFSPKIQGTMNLGLFFKERDLDFFLLFSSLNAITGGIEQVAYSGANAFLDAVAAHNFSDRHLNTLSINWPGWKKERKKLRWNKDSYRKKYQEQYEANAISVKEVMSTLKLCLSFGPTYHLIVSPNEFNLWREKMMRKEIFEVNSPMSERYERPPLATELAPATTPEELFLVDLWESIINIAPIGVDDNFFELGGHSLMGLEMLSRIAEERKVSLQINDLYEYPTIRSFMTLLNNQSLKDPFTEFHMVEHKESKSTLVTQLQEGSGESSLYLFQPLGVNVYYYQPLVKYLDPALSVYAFRLSEVETGKQLPQTIREIAENSVDILLQIDSGEEYHLAGASFGGVIAYEAAQCLSRRGKSINLLSLFDSPNPKRLPRLPETDAEILHYIFKQWAPLSLDKLEAKQSLEEQCEYIVEFIKSSKQTSYEIHATQVVQLLQLFRTGGKALKEYDPEHFDGTLLFLKPLTYHPDYDKSADKSWRKLTNDFEIHNVPGDHLSMNQDPHVESIATILNSRLCS